MNERNYLDVNLKKKKIDFPALLVRLELNNLPAGGSTHGCGTEDKGYRG